MCLSLKKLTISLPLAGNSKTSDQSEYGQGSPPQGRDNGRNTNRSSGPLLRRRAVDLSASNDAEPPPQRQHTSNSPPTPSNTVVADQPLRISRESQYPPSTTGGADQPVRISRELVAGSPFSSSQGQRQTGIVDARRAAAPPDGQRLLRRSFEPRNGSPQSAGGRSSSFRGRGSLGRLRGGRSSQPRRRRRESDLTDDDGDEDPLDLEERMNGPKPERKPVPYQPEAITMEDLRLDWPTTAIDGTGLAESAQQKLKCLAKRIPHGHHNPHDLAERFHKGEMVHFVSEEERKEVLAIAAELAKSRADMLTERKGEPVVPEDMSFSDLGGEEKMKMGLKMVKGEYPALQSQKLPFLNHVTTLLRNNGTYHELETSKFMEKIQSLLPVNQGGQQTQKVPER